MEALQAAGAVCCSKSWAHSSTHAAAKTAQCCSTSKEISIKIPSASQRLPSCWMPSSSSFSVLPSSQSGLRQSSCMGNGGGWYHPTVLEEQQQDELLWSTTCKKGWKKLPSCRASPWHWYGSASGSGSAIAVASATGPAAEGEVKHDPQTLSRTFAELKKRGTPAFIPFIMSGHPSLEITEAALLELDASGADIIELGVPYSDPLADGPVIHAAATHALEGNTTMDCVFTLLKKTVPKLKAPIVLFTYFNPILKRGLETFLQDVKAAGAAGLVIPDLPLEETRPISELTALHGLELVLLVTPTTPIERMRAIAAASQGFVYLVSVTGVTGARAQVAGGVEKMLQQLKQVTDKPVAVGFGISTAEQAQQVVDWGAEGVIVGSAIVRALESGGSTVEAAVSSASALASSIKAGAISRPLAAT